MDIYQNISNENAFQGGAGHFIRRGSASYCVDQLPRGHQTAQEILNATPLPNNDVVDTLREGVIAPVRKLFETLGISPRISPIAVEPSNQE